MKRIVALLLLLTLIFSGCSRTPPSVEEFQALLTDEYETIEIIVTFLFNCGYGSAVIWDARGTFSSYGRDIQITDELVLSAIEKLSEKTSFIGISILDGTLIKFQLWNFGTDKGSGIAYAVDYNALEHLGYVTEIVPLSQDNWFYYVTDLNKWRANGRKDATISSTGY